MLSVADLTVRYGDMAIIKQVSFSIAEKQWLMIVGPNGAGKSTIIRAISGGAKYEGEILCLGKSIKAYRPAEIARVIGVLPQYYYISYAFTVEEIVRMGRYAHNRSFFAKHSNTDEAAIERAVELTGLAPLLEQSVLTLSGGELQRALLAQLFAQDPQILILDEPTNHLDLVYQKQIFALVGDWLKEPGHAVISVVHDLSLAKAYGTHALLLNEGQAIAQGDIQQVLSAENLKIAYRMDVYEWMHNMLGQWL